MSTNAHEPNEKAKPAKPDGVQRSVEILSDPYAPFKSDEPKPTPSPLINDGKPAEPLAPEAPQP